MTEPAFPNLIPFRFEYAVNCQTVAAGFKPACPLVAEREPQYAYMAASQQLGISRRGLMIFLFAVSQTIEELWNVDAGLPEELHQNLKRNLDRLTQTGLFPKSLEYDVERSRALHDYFVQIRCMYTEHYSSLSSDELARDRTDRWLADELLDFLD